MNRRGWEIVLPRDSASPVTGIIQGKKIYKVNKEFEISVLQKRNVSWSGIHYNISVLCVIPNQFLSSEVCNLVVHSRCFFICYCMKMKDFSFVVSYFLSFWSIYPKRMVIDCDIDLSTNNISVVVSG